MSLRTDYHDYDVEGKFVSNACWIWPAGTNSPSPATQAIIQQKWVETHGDNIPTTEQLLAFCAEHGAAPNKTTKETMGLMKRERAEGRMPFKFDWPSSEEVAAAKATARELLEAHMANLAVKSATPLYTNEGLLDINVLEAQMAAAPRAGVG